MVSQHWPSEHPPLRLQAVVDAPEMCTRPAPRQTCELQYLVRQHIASSHEPDEHTVLAAAVMSASPAEVQVCALHRGRA